MAEIDGIVALPRRPGRFSILVDGKSVATLGLDAIARLRLAVGKSIDGLEAEIEAEAKAIALYDRAVNMIAFRARSATELSRTLVKKGEESAPVQAVIARLVDGGLLDDAAFAESFVRSKVLGARESRRRVQMSLMRKGVARDVVDEAIGKVFAEEEVDQSALAVAAAEKKMRSLTKYEPAVQKRRLYAFLARRGFAPDEIRAALDAVKAR